MNIKNQSKELFDDLFVLDLANNHQGSFEHAKKIINGISALPKTKKLKVAIKFQFRNLQTFIYKNDKVKSKNKHISRFLSTEMNFDLFGQLLKLVKNKKLKSICTPFDEFSVDQIIKMNFDIIKVASCSANDWPLLEKISSTGKPVIFSTGGLTYQQVDDVCSFFDHRGVDYAIMHCVSIYPTPLSNCNLNNIDELKLRYPEKIIGWSTHEDPENFDIIKMAVAKGARMFERHIGLETNKIKLNAYSSTPEIIEKWFESYIDAKSVCGENTRTISIKEQDSILELQRGVFVKNSLKKNSTLTYDNTYFAMPAKAGQLLANDWTNDLISRVEIGKDQRILKKDIKRKTETENTILKDSIHDIKTILNKSKIVLNTQFDIEFSHHYGVKKFRKVGATIINCINRDYCKKIIVMLPNQVHPPHFHKRKEETFQVLYGKLVVYLEGKKKILNTGETCLVQPGVWHSFMSNEECVFEEISTTHFNDDSFYKDKSINKLKRSQRKTYVQNWGRFEI